MIISFPVIRLFIRPLYLIGIILHANKIQKLYPNNPSGQSDKKEYNLLHNICHY